MADPDLYIAYNGHVPTTAAIPPVTTGTAIKTLQQLSVPSTRPLTIKGWHIDFDGIAAATPIRCELIETGTVAATVTAYTAADLVAFSDPNAPASLLTVGTGASGFTATAEGTITTTRPFDYQQVSPMGSYTMMWPLGEEPQVLPGRILRIRVTAGAAVNAATWILWREA